MPIHYNNKWTINYLLYFFLKTYLNYYLKIFLSPILQSIECKHDKTFTIKYLMNDSK